MPSQAFRNFIEGAAMADRFVETTNRGLFSRLGGSFIGLLLGPVFVIAAIVLLSWNEGRAVQASVGLADAARSVVEAPADTVSPANEGKLVHVTGAATAQSKIADADLNLDFAGQVAVGRTVEMYQWKEKQESSSQNNTGGSQTTTTTYTYSQVWSADPIDSATFKHPDGHTNPAMPLTSHRFAASDAKLGGFALDDDTLHAIEPSQSLKPDAPAGWKADGDDLYKGNNPSVPVTGDVRVHYAGLPSGTTISVLAQQSHGGFAAYTTANGYTVHLARVGNASATEMVADARKTASLWTWILRGAGTLLMFIGFTLFFGPLATLASILPFLGSLVRGAGAAFAFVLTVPIALVTIAIAWIAFRPLIGGGLLLIAAGALYGLWRWHHGRTAAHVAPKAA
jgi:hypothetical protein